MSDLEKRVKDLEAKGLTAWGKLPDKAKMAVACAIVAAVVYVLVKLHVL